MFRKLILVMVAVPFFFSGFAASAEELTGAGGTAIYPVLSEWAKTYNQETGTFINYQAIGSGGGIAQIKSKTVDFANSDMPLKPDELSESGLAQFPAVIISITPAVNLPGIKPGELVLDGKTLADIYLGKITKWNDPAIRKLNPKVGLPDLGISTIHRSDASGTTFNFTDYLSKASPKWKEKVGEGLSVSWPTGIGSKGNAGVAIYVQEIEGSIGYVEYAYVMQNHLTYTKMVNQARKEVEPTMGSFQSAAANADLGKAEDFCVILTDQPGKDSWPITAATYVLMQKDGAPVKNEAVLRFMHWALTEGRSEAKSLDYVPLPGKVVSEIEDYWTKELKTPRGQPEWKAAAEGR
jgi:phosphate transport system substrate-binding protein